MTAAVDSASSVAGVKDLFDDCEETLLPVKTQLLRYKSRDLASSHQVRTRCKIFGPRKLVRKTVIGPSDGNQDLDFSDIEFPRYYKSLSNDADLQQTVTSSSENEDPAADVPFHQWLEERKKLRNNLNNIGLESDWLKRKPIKSALEERVLQRLKNQDAEKKENAGKSVKNVRFDAAKRKDELKSKRLNEFRRVSSACQKTGLRIDDNMLKDVLLHPGDIPPEQWNTRARQPPNNLSENFWKYRSKKRHRRRRRRTADSVDSDESDEEPLQSTAINDNTYIITFPRSRDVNGDRHQMNLSTGRAIIGRKVDCWMTHEEYEKISQELDPVLQRTKSNYNAFWVSHDDGVRGRVVHSKCGDNCFDKCDPAKSKISIIDRVHIKPHDGKKCNHGYDNNLRTWPTDGRFVKYGGERHRRDLNYLK